MEDEHALTWRTSSASGNSGGQCVEVAAHGVVYVRDSKNPHGPVLEVAPQIWGAFIEHVKQSDA